ncbi:PAS domain-containing sensor histidine kinase [Haloferax larsenii]|uniref:histidine kinase n=1 Tax=Haloferax larsenii TaxID=302484 RepID=A0ABY5RDK0_HALLR|nr:PAS domain-containing sensor histidine kinase [Haloferax larsenii]UVE49523.1 PAS domain-containing sensor histidine kinase [Haloferax larsenii]
MSKDSRRELERTKRFLNLVLETGEMNGSKVDTDLRHTWVHNSSPEPPEAEILGKTDEELFPSDISQPTTELKRDAIETESRVEREFTFVKPWGQNRYRAAAEPLYDANDDVEGAMFAAIDLSDRYRFLERTTDAVFTVDSEWVVTFWNDRMSDRTRVDANEIVGENYWDVVGEDVPSKLEAEYRDVMETGGSREFEHYFPEPMDMWVEIRVFADDGGFTVLSRDISERKEYEKRLERQRNTLEILNQVLRHDIRNDLQLVIAYAEFVSDKLDDEGKEHIEIVQARANHAVELTKTAGDISKVLFSEASASEPVNFRRVLERELEDARSSFPESVIISEGPLPNVTVRGDDMLESVFRNLLKNANQHNDKEIPNITVSAEERDEDVVVHIADNGPGIPDGHKEHIFGKGEKGLGSNGTGMGLYLVQSLVDTYGGDITVEDNDPDGTVFSVTLPKATRSAA